MKKVKKLQILDEEYEWIKAVLNRSLLRSRFPELTSLDDNELREELRKLIIQWDGIFVRWLRRMYRPVGIEVEYEPEKNQVYPITFQSLPESFPRLPGYDVKLPSPLGPVEITRDQLQNIINGGGCEGLVNYYLEKRLSQLSNTLIK